MAIAGRTMGLAAVLALCAAATPVESWIDAPLPAGALKGVLLTPAKPGPALLIIPGSGPTDHDGNSPAGLRAGTYRLLAEGQAAHGITSLRIDKRGLFASRAAVPDADAVTIGDYAADVHAWIGVLRGANHVLKSVPADDRGADLASYANPALPLAPRRWGGHSRFCWPPWVASANNCTNTPFWNPTRFFDVQLLLAAWFLANRGSLHDLRIQVAECVDLRRF